MFSDSEEVVVDAVGLDVVPAKLFVPTDLGIERLDFPCVVNLAVVVLIGVSVTVVFAFSLSGAKEVVVTLDITVFCAAVVELETVDEDPSNEVEF